MYVHVCVCVCVYPCVRAYVRVCIHACVCVCALRSFHPHKLLSTDLSYYTVIILIEQCRIIKSGLR